MAAAGTTGNRAGGTALPRRLVQHERDPRAVAALAREARIRPRRVGRGTAAGADARVRAPCGWSEQPAAPSPVQPAQLRALPALGLARGGRCDALLGAGAAPAPRDPAADARGPTALVPTEGTRRATAWRHDLRPGRGRLWAHGGGRTRVEARRRRSEGHNRENLRPLRPRGRAGLARLPALALSPRSAPPSGGTFDSDAPLGHRGGRLPLHGACDDARRRAPAACASREEGEEEVLQEEARQARAREVPEEKEEGRCSDAGQSEPDSGAVADGHHWSGRDRSDDQRAEGWP